MTNTKQSIDFFRQKGDPLVHRPVSRQSAAPTKRAYSVPVTRSSSQPIFKKTKPSISDISPDTNSSKRASIRQSILPKKPLEKSPTRPSKPTPSLSKPDLLEPKSPFLESVRVEKRPLGDSSAEPRPVTVSRMQSFPDDPEKDPRRKRKADPVRNERERAPKKELPLGFIILLTVVLGVIAGAAVYMLISR